MEFAEGVDHIKSVHVDYRSVDNQLRTEYKVKAEHMENIR